jgi:glutathione peroxidase
MASKVSIQGENRHPVYRWLMSKSLNGLSDAVVRWNFTKFLVNGEGQWIATYPSSVSPMDAQIIKQLP